MYAHFQRGAVSGREAYPFFSIALENLVVVGGWLLATYLFWPVWQPAGIPVLGIGWLLLVLVIQILLKKHNCSGCYYYGKWCHLGWGKIAAVLFEPDSGNSKVGEKLALFYVLSPPTILVTSLLFLIFGHPTPAYWGVWGLYLLSIAISFPLRKKGCRQCALRSVCPGSAVKQAAAQ